MRRPSEAALVRLGMTPAQAKAWRAWAADHPNHPRRSLALAAEWLPDGQGVQYIQWGDEEYPHQVYAVDVADPYTPTLLWTVGTSTFRVGCWGDVAERHPNAKWWESNVSPPKVEDPR